MVARVFRIVARYSSYQGVSCGYKGALDGC